MMTLEEIATQIKSDNPKKQLIYAFNGVGKTRLSTVFKELFDIDKNTHETREKVIYYNAFTEDLFSWDNDRMVFQIKNNQFTQWILQEQGLNNRVVDNFQRYTNNRILPRFNEDFSEISFQIRDENNEKTDNIKISKGEESNFIWSVFYALLEQIIQERNILEEDNRSTQQFNILEYIFIDDPVSSLDENHLIELAVDLANLIKGSQSDIKFVITTHNPLFYNVIYNELGMKKGKILTRDKNNILELIEKSGDSNPSFSYHLHLKWILENAIKTQYIQKYHFTLLRNLYEKTASFLGYTKWGDLLPDDKNLYYARIINFTSHSTLSNEVMAEPTEAEKQIINFLLNHLVETYHFYKIE